MDKEVENTIDKNYKIDENKLLLNDDKLDRVYFNFVNGGPRVEIHGKTDKKYDITFVDLDTNEEHITFKEVPSGEWRSYDKQYYINWKLIVKESDTTNEIKNYNLDLKGKNVLITYESSALGDTIAWMPYVEEFRKKHNCRLVCSSFHNEIFKDIYPNIQFIPRGQPLSGVHVAYRLGWFGSGHASDRNPNTCHIIPLQKVAADILGIKYDKEIRTPLIHDTRTKKFNKSKYVVITTCSTAQFKYWNNPHAWQQLVDILIKKGYSVINVGKQPNFLKNVYNFTGKRDMKDLFNIFQHCDFFIGLPSGLAWLAWGLNKKSVMITGISESFCEFREDNYRVEPEKNKCKGCFNNPIHTFNKGLWLWCPENQDDNEKRFECTKSITPKMVHDVIVQVENDLKNNQTHWSMTDEECNKYLNGLDVLIR